MANYEQYLEEKARQEASLPSDYPEKFRDWLDEMQRSGYRVLEVRTNESPYRRYCHGYVSPGGATLILCECIEHKETGAVEKFAEVWADALTVRRMVALVMREEALGI